MKVKTNTRVILAVLSLVTAVTLLGCQNGPRGKNFGDQTNGLYVTKDLYLRDSLVESFDTAKYDIKEYEPLLDQELSEYNANHPFTAPEEKLDKNGKPIPPVVKQPIEKCVCKVENNWIYQQLLYASSDDFLTYNSYTLKNVRGGSKLLLGRLEGEIDSELLSIGFKTPDGKTIGIDELYYSKNASKYIYVVVDFEANLYGEGELVAYSTTGTYSSEGGFVAAEAGKVTVAIFLTE